MSCGHIVHAFLAAIVLCASAVAVADDASRFYIGGSVGQSKTKLDELRSDINNNLASSGIAVIGSSTNEADTGYKLFGGYQFNQKFALEAGYIDFGKFSVSSNTILSGTASVDLKIKGVFIDAIGMLPVGGNVSLLGRLGIIHAKVNADLGASGAIVVVASSLSAKSTKASVGVGAQYDFNKTEGVRGEWQRYSKLGNDSTGKRDVDLLSVGIVVGL